MDLLQDHPLTSRPQNLLGKTSESLGAKKWPTTGRADDWVYGDWVLSADQNPGIHPDHGYPLVVDAASEPCRTP